MGWFSEQTEQRKKHDNEIFENSFIKLASAVVGEDEAARLCGKNPNVGDALKAILHFYGKKAGELPTGMTDIYDKIEYYFRPEGIMYRNVELEHGWYKEAGGPMLAWRTDTGKPVALLQRGRTYYFCDEKTGQNVRVNKKTQGLISENAVLFYEPFPLKKLDIGELIRYIAGRIDRYDIAMTVFSALCVALVGLFLPALNKRLFSAVVGSGSLTALMAIAVFMVCVFVSKNLFEIVQEMVSVGINTKIGVSVEAASMMRLLSLSPDFFKKYSAGELANRTGQISALCSMLVSAVFSMGLTSIFSIVYIGQIFFYAPGLVASAVTIILVTVAVTVVSALWQMKISRERMEYAAKENGLAFSFITGIQKIRLAGAEKRAFAKWAEVYSEEARLTYDPPMFLKINTAVNMAISLIGTMVLYYMAITTKVSAPDYYAFFTSYGVVQGAFMALAGAALLIADARPILEMCRPILESEPEVSETKHPVTRITGNIELSNVSFAYNDDMPKVIDGLSLRIRPGQYVAVVGKTGCGKSTLMRLLLGFERPQKGAVYYDGVDIQRMDLRSLRRRIGTVMQDGKLFHGDIFSNIAISAPNITLAQAWEAAETADIADDIRKMPMGMNTVISEGSGGISGGQRQRLMIARAVAPKPKVLILDEATSALDNITQKRISDALGKLKCTRIVIAHRLSTIMGCDRIIVLDNGKIAEDGTYDELIEKNGIFSELVKRQQLNKT